VTATALAFAFECIGNSGDPRDIGNGFKRYICEVFSTTSVHSQSIVPRPRQKIQNLISPPLDLLNVIVANPEISTFASALQLCIDRSADRESFRSLTS